LWGELAASVGGDTGTPMREREGGEREREEKRVVSIHPDSTKNQETLWRDKWVIY